jgi:hypothetical protein
MCGSCLRETDNNSSDYITYNTLQHRGSQNKTKTDYWFSKYNRVLHHVRGREPNLFNMVNFFYMPISCHVVLKI